MLSWQARLLNIIGPLILSSALYVSFLKLKMTKENWIYYARRLIEKLACPPKQAITKQIVTNEIKGIIISQYSEKSQKVILFLHGGAFILGSTRFYTELAYAISRTTKCDVFLLDYRLAPEYAFPCANEDAFNAYQYLIQIGYAAEDIIIAGDSAGGGLTLATLLSIRDKQLKLPKCAICLAPFLDFTFSAESIIKNRKKDYMLPINEALKSDVIRYYLKEQNPNNPLVSPLFADFTGLPPMLIQVGSHDRLLDDSLRFAQKAKDNDVHVLLEIWDKMPHDFHLLVRILPEARRAIRQINYFINSLVQTT